MTAYPPSSYAAGIGAPPTHPIFEGEDEADLCIIGGGFTGLTAALAMAERGLKVVLLEAKRIGWGASGRNGGQIHTGLRKGPVELIARFGQEEARRLFALGLEAKNIVMERILRHDIACDLKPGTLVAAHKASDMGWMAEEVASLKRDMGYNHATLLGKAEVAQEVASSCYHGGILDEGGLHLDPLKYCLGLARAAQAAGVRLYENSPVTVIEGRARPQVRTHEGSVRARHVVVGCNGYLGRLVPEIAPKIMPLANYILATEPLGEEEAHALIPRDVAVCDTKFVVDYYRLSADRRLLFGGGEKYTAQEPADIAAFVRPYLLRVFPQLAARRIDFAWGGMLAVTQTRFPSLGRIGDVFYAQGYSGQGIAMAALAATVIGEAVIGDARRFDRISALPTPPFPGGTVLRQPLQVAGMMWYALRDRFP